MTLEQILGKVFNVDPSAINDATSPENTPSWDSFNGLALIQELEKQYKTRFDINDMAEVKNVGDLKKILQKYGRT